MKTLVRLIVVACLAGTAFAQQPNQPPKPGPEQQKLQLWVGEWTYEGESQTSFLGPGEKFTGRMTGRFILNGFGLETVAKEQSPSGEIESTEVDTYDPVTKTYPYFYAESDGLFSQGSLTTNGNVTSWEGSSMANGKRYKERGTNAVAPDGMSFTRSGEISEDGKAWVPWFTYHATKVQDSEKSAVEATVRGFEQAVQDYNHPKADSLFTPEARWIEGSLPRKIEDEWQLVDKLKAAGIRIAYRLHDFETHVQGDVAWVTLTIDGTFSADSAEGQKLLPHKTESGCVVGNPCESRMTYVESEVLVKTASGWKIALGHTTALPKTQK
jgi:hypothetical protein